MNSTLERLLTVKIEHKFFILQKAKTLRSHGQLMLLIYGSTLLLHIHSQNKLIIAFINIFDYIRPALVPSYTYWGFCNRLKG